MNATSAISATSAVPSSAAWIAGDELGVSRRHLRRLFTELAPLGAARRDGGLLLFQRNHPSLARFIHRAAQQRATCDLSDCSHRQVEDARRKERIVRAGGREIAAYMADRACGRTVAVEWFCQVRAAQLPELAAPAGVAVKSFRRWDALYRTGGIRALVDTRGGRTDGCESYTPAAREHCRALWLDDRKWSAKLCYELTCAEGETRGWEIPSYRTVCKDLASIPRAVRILARHGDKAYESQCAPRVQRDRESIAAGDHYCGDECTLDLYARAPDGKGGWKRVRPILTAWLCERSRVFVGWWIDDRANTDTILAAFKGALRDWGTPRHVTIDNGHDYTCAAGVTKRTKRAAADADRVASVFTDLDITPHFAIPYNPQSKLIEANFATVHERFDKLFDSYCGGKPEDRPESACAIPLHALPTIDDVRARFADWLIAYHARPHSGDGMFGYAPEQAWAQFAPAVRRERVDGARLDLLCARYEGPRTVTRNGVTHRGIDYGRGDPALLDLIGRKVWLKLDPERADLVHVCDESRRLVCTARAARLAGATQSDVRDHQRAKARRKRAVRAEADTRHVELDGSVDGVIRAQLARAKSAQQLLREAPGPESIQLVRPDVVGDTAQAIAQSSRTAASRAVASKRARQAVEPDATDDDVGDGCGSILSMYADLANVERADDGDDEADGDSDTNAGGMSLADLADLYTGHEDRPDDLPDDANGFAILAERAEQERAQEARYGTAG